MAIGEAASTVASVFEGLVPVAQASSIHEAVRTAAAEADRGDTVLLSPAGASFDQFADFEARGEAFRALVRPLLSESAA